MSKNEISYSIEIESYYVKKTDGFIYYYWRIKDFDNAWNIQKTAMKKLPTKEMIQQAQKKILEDKPDVR